jgi:uncharacterized protein (UPF0333 family)
MLYVISFHLKGGFIMMTQKGQGTIEYLVIIAIVVVIALVVVGLLLQVMNQGSGIPESTAKIAWKSAEPWAIADWTNTSTTLTVVLRNNSSEALDFDSMTIGSDTNNTGQTGVSPGGTLVRTFAKTCSTGTKYAYAKSTTYIDYNTSAIANKRENAVADIVGSC